MNENAIAIIGMSGRFPGARDVTEFWRNLSNGVEAIRRFSDAELLAAGVSPEELAEPDYVKFGVTLEGLDQFDASFFGFSPREASIMDPQHRLFLECAWEALENAGHAPGSREGSIGVFAGSGMNSYMIHNLLTNAQLMTSAGLFLIRQTGNDKDVLATRVSYELDLHGPSINVQTACSTSLVAVHLACQSLLNQECDMALAGGVTIEFPHGHGYVYREGEIQSRDGHCRAFDADSSGTVFSSGAGVVVLRRLQDAVEDGDTIHAVILGSAINNDGARKVGYLAPSVEGQTEVVREALGVAGVSAADISYVEMHGTGTRVGDPIEVKALTKAFSRENATPGTCAIGSLKTNIGHLDTAAGVAGLIKATLSLRHGQIPPSLHFREPNPLIDFEHSPFFVNTTLCEWAQKSKPRRAGVTSLGIGGTNAHVVLEEAPRVAPAAEGVRRQQLLVLSAKTATALNAAAQNLAGHLREHPETWLADAAFTLQSGRKAFAHRRALVAADGEEAAALLATPAAGRVFSGQAAAARPEVVFLFSGQGSQYVEMGRGLYESEPGFRRHLDDCATRLQAHLGLDLRTLFYPQQDPEAAAERLGHTAFTQPALFSIEYALAQWWIEHGVQPAAMLGHSIGEYTAACIAGVFPLEDGLRLSATRGRLMGSMQSGAMLSVAAAVEAVGLPPELAIAAINGPQQFVASGTSEAIQKFAGHLEEQQIPCRLLHTSHAFHSSMMDPMLGEFRAQMAAVRLAAPTIPFVSNLTGTWITASEATDPDYWVRHLRGTVRFSDGLSLLFREPARVLLEVGPGQALTALARQHSARPKTVKVLPSMRHPQDAPQDSVCLLNTLGQLWIEGVEPGWEALHSGAKPRRIPLPTYPFERKRYWIEPDVRRLAAAEPQPAEAPATVLAPAGPLLHHRVWKKSPAPGAATSQAGSWLLLSDSMGLGSEIAAQLRRDGRKAIEVIASDRFNADPGDRYLIRPGVRADYDELLQELSKRQSLPAHIVSLWPLAGAGGNGSLQTALERSFYSLLFLAQAWGGQDLGAVEITSVSNGLQSVMGEESFEAARATLLGPTRVIPKELPGVDCRSIDLDREFSSLRAAAGTIITECLLRSAECCVAYRGSERWVEGLEPASHGAQSTAPRLREKGVYLITGGLGGIGLTLAKHLAETVHARLVLTARTPLPPRAEWNAILAAPEDGSGIRGKLARLREIESAGGEVLAIAADVCDAPQIAGAVRMAREKFGTIDGVIHAAGLVDDAPMLIKSPESAARVLAPKVQGTLALHAALGETKLDFFLLFSSISSLTPPAGQVDYAAANAFLDAFATSHHGITAVNWDLWSDVGLGQQGPANAPPMLGRVISQTAAETLCSGALLYDRDWLVNEHRLKDGTALVPGTGYLQLAAAALVRDRIAPGIVFENVLFVAPLTVAPGEAKPIAVHLRREGAGFQFAVMSQDGQWSQHATGEVARSHKALPGKRNLAEIRERCSAASIAFDDQNRTRQERYFDFGPRWRNLQRLHLGDREALSELCLAQEFVSDQERWPLHPALLDLATGSALYAIAGYRESDSLYLPLSYKRITIYRPLPAHFFSHIRLAGEDVHPREIVSFEITLLDESGQVLAEIEEFSMRRMADADGLLRPALAATVAAEREIAAELLNHRGLSNAEAVAAFDQILSAELPAQVIIARGGVSKKADEPAAVAPVPATARTPEGEIETAIAGWWKELLGVDEVGRDDDFFDLGGHSLIGVRLFSKIEKTYQVRLELASLFEVRTVRQIAEMIRKAKATTAAKERVWSSLVPIQTTGSRIPIFCVHALGPSVLFYRRFAEDLGPDQPFYAFQSPLATAAKIHEVTVEELATLYNKELLSFYPEGPVYLGGSSFGGLVAFAMAQQLCALGRRPELLLMLDTSVPRCHQKLPVPDQVLGHWQNLRKSGAEYLLKRAKSKLTYLGSRVSNAVQAKVSRLQREYYERSGRSMPVDLRTMLAEEAHWRAMEQYTVQPYPGKITLIRAEEVLHTVATRRDATLGWNTIASEGLDIYDVPGNHISMFYDPHVPVLTRTMKTVLEKLSTGPQDARVIAASA